MKVFGITEYKNVWKVGYAKKLYLKDFVYIKISKTWKGWIS